MNEMDRHAAADYRRPAQLCAAAVVFLALLALLGWATGWLLLAKWSAGYLPAAPVAASSFAVLGAGLFVHLRWPGQTGCGPGRVLVVAAGLFVTLAAALPLANSIGGWHLALEHPGWAGAFNISLLTAAVLLLAGLSVLALPPGSAAPVSAAGKGWAGGRANLAGTLAAVVTVMGAVLLLCCYFRHVPLARRDGLLPIPLPTTALMLFSGTGLLAAAGAQAWPLRLLEGNSVAARLSRALLPVMLGLTVATNWIALGLQNMGLGRPAMVEAVEALVCFIAGAAVTLLVTRGLGRSIERAEAATNELSRRYQALFNSISDAVFVFELSETGLPGRCLEVNEAASSCLGYSAHELREMTPVQLMTPENREQLPLRVKGLLQEGRALWESTVLTKAGHQFPVETSTRLFELSGRPAAMVIVRDISERKQVEAERRQNEERYRMFYENSPVPFHSLDRDGRFVEVNQAFLDTLGYTRQEIIGRLAIDIQTERARATFAGNFDLYKQRGFAQAVECEFVRKDGTHLHVTLNARLLRDPDGAFVKDYCFWSDITALKQAQATAEEASRAKDRLLATVSHELRTPLTPVLVSLSMLEEDPGTPPAMLPDISMMRGRIELEARLIDGLLDLTRMTRGKLRLKTQRVDAHALLEHALALAVADADAFHPRIERDLRAADHFVWTDPTRLQQVCWNIIKNALQYTPDSGTLCIRSRNTAGTGGAAAMLELEFADTGAGIEPELLPRLFHEFERGKHANVNRLGGLGLGLCIARTLIEQLGGSIQAASEGPGKGAVFTVGLPVIQGSSLELPADLPAVEPPPSPPVTHASLPASAPVVPPSPAPAPASAAAGPPAGSRLLLVEDDAGTSEVYCRVLRGLGYDVSTAATVQQAMAAGECQRFDLLICDIGLPDGSGWELMRWFSQRQPICGIALSGCGTPDDLQRSQAAGFARHLIKPIAIGALREAIQELQQPAQMTT